MAGTVAQTMPRPQFRYSRWDGTQVGFDLDADAVLEQMTDDLLYHGDLNAALRRLLQSGSATGRARWSRDRDLLDRLRRERQERLDRFDLGGVYDEIAEELRQVVDTERAEIDRQVATPAPAATRAGPRRRRAPPTSATCSWRCCRGPRGHGAKPANYDFASAEAQRRFDELVERLRQQVLDSYVNRMTGAVESMTPEDMARMKDMLAELNHMLDQRSRGGGPDFEGFMALRRLLPREPPEPRRAAGGAGPPHGRHAGDAGVDDARAAGADPAAGRTAPRRHGPALAGRSARPAAAGPVPGDGLGPALQLPGPGSARHGRGGGRMEELGDLDRLEQLLRAPPTPQLAEVRHRPRPGAAERRFARSLDELARLPACSGGRTGRPARGQLELTPKVSAASAATPCTTCSSAWPATSWAATSWSGRAPGTSSPTRPRPTSSATRSTSTSSARSATPWRSGCGTPVLLSPDDFEVERTEQSFARRPCSCSTCRCRCPCVTTSWPPRRWRWRCTRSSRCSSARLPGPGRLQRGGPRDPPAGPARGFVGLRVRHQHAARSRSAGGSWPASRAPSRSS